MSAPTSLRTALALSLALAPALAPAAFNATAIACVLVLVPWLARTGRPTILAAAIGALAGGLVQLVMQWPLLHRSGFRWSPRIEWRQDGLIAVLALGQAAFSLYGSWIRESQPLIGVFIGYYVVVPYRLIREYRKRWEYQRKNELLLQVEAGARGLLPIAQGGVKDQYPAGVAGHGGLTRSGYELGPV